MRRACRPPPGRGAGSWPSKAHEGRNTRKVEKAHQTAGWRLEPSWDNRKRKKNKRWIEEQVE